MPDDKPNTPQQPVQKPSTNPQGTPPPPRQNPGSTSTTRDKGNNNLPPPRKNPSQSLVTETKHSKSSDDDIISE